MVRTMKMMMSGDDEDDNVNVNEGCSTPERWECRIPVGLAPPPPPKKKKTTAFSIGKKTKEPPKNGYFRPPDLEEIFFKLESRRQACA